MKPRTGKIINCRGCNKEFYIPINRFATAVYCSRSCKALYTLEQINATCGICNKQFTHISSRCNKAKYCSRTCYYKAMKNRGTVTIKCRHCDKDFKTSPSKNRIYCSKSCVNKENKKSFRPKYTTVRKQMIRRDMLKSCIDCGYDEVPAILGVHHIDHNRKNNSLDNLAVLCPNCHSLRHNKHIAH